jgi:hypothetical protein
MRGKLTGRGNVITLAGMMTHSDSQVESVPVVLDHQEGRVSGSLNYFPAVGNRRAVGIVTVDVYPRTMSRAVAERTLASAIRMRLIRGIPDHVVVALGIDVDAEPRVDAGVDR